MTPDLMCEACAPARTQLALADALRPKRGKPDQGVSPPLRPWSGAPDRRPRSAEGEAPVAGGLT